MSKHTMLIVSVAAIALAAGTGRFALAQQASPEVLGELADNQGIFVDGKHLRSSEGQRRVTLLPRLRRWAPWKLAQAQSSLDTGTSYTVLKGVRLKCRHKP